MVAYIKYLPAVTKTNEHDPKSIIEGWASDTMFRIHVKDGVVLVRYRKVLTF